MGVSASQPFETLKVADPAPDSAKPATVTAPGAPTAPEEKPLFNNCWSCRVLSGSGMTGAGFYVYWVARKPMKMGYAPSPGNVIQMAFGISIACWGIVILADPKGKAYRVV
ncbi:distal membrane-arm assembly complex protein 1 [Erinaceus europaeus]|uniref:Distal membrane-arm assembly complex protein 1 n=1 Tax=Erinaceus europaeus TaxID=9365 RepID=A0A1S2ZUR2_ERIEU|nr:distal membrane-arm assembly complex protein 1 [Erinaceus europaeus]